MRAGACKTCGTPGHVEATSRFIDKRCSTRMTDGQVTVAGVASVGLLPPVRRRSTTVKRPYLHLVCTLATLCGYVDVANISERPAQSTASKSRLKSLVGIQQLDGAVGAAPALAATLRWSLSLPWRRCYIFPLHGACCYHVECAERFPSRPRLICPL